MKKIKVLKTIKASPSNGVVFEYKVGEELILDNEKLTEHLYNWFIANKLAIDITKKHQVQELLRSKQEEREKEKAERELKEEAERVIKETEQNIKRIASEEAERVSQEAKQAEETLRAEEKEKEKEIVEVEKEEEKEIVEKAIENAPENKAFVKAPKNNKKRKK